MTLYRSTVANADDVRMKAQRERHRGLLFESLPYPAPTTATKALVAKRIAAQVARQEREDNFFL